MKNKSLRTVKALAEQKFIKPSEIDILNKVTHTFSLAISDHMQKHINKNDTLDPIAKQFIPHANELNITKTESHDPIGDTRHTKVAGIVHRYEDRCLLMPVQVCPVYCRFCFRREKVGKSKGKLTPQELNNALNYIAEHPEIWEVILTGGDPLILKPEMIKTIIQGINKIPHVDIIRIHTRIPIVTPDSITQELIQQLKSDKTLYIILHGNHPQELTKEAIDACARLSDAGIPLLSQTVLLKDINDNIETLSELMRLFIKNRIKPYYLHHGDLAKGTSHFRTTIQKGQELMQALRGRFSGLCQPTYVLDIPNGYGKVPIGPNYLKKESEQYLLEDYCGNVHFYPEI